nr:hypothetical protein [Tanacetum cinerariifolium]
MEHQDDLTDVVPPTPHDLPLLGGHILEVLALEEAKTTHDKVITKLKLRVGRIAKKRKARTSQPMKRRLFKGRVKTSNDKSLGGSIVDQVSTTRPEVSTVTPSTPLTTTTIFGNKDLTIAQTLIKLRSKKAKEKGVAFIDVEEPPRLTRSTKTLQPLPTIDPKDKELPQRIYEEELLELDRAQKERQKQEETTIADLTEEFDEIQTRMDVDHEVACLATPAHPSQPLPPLPSSLYLPPLVLTSLPLPFPPLPPLLASLFIPPPVDRREDFIEAKLPPRKRLCLTAPTSRYEVGDSSIAARPTGGHRAYYGVISTLDAETRP